MEFGRWWRGRDDEGALVLCFLVLAMPTGLGCGSLPYLVVPECNNLEDMGPRETSWGTRGGRRVGQVIQMQAALGSNCKLNLDLSATKYILTSEGNFQREMQTPVVWRVLTGPQICTGFLSLGT